MTLADLKRPVRANLGREEYQLLQDLRRRSPAQQPRLPQPTLGDRIADRVATVMGSWPFIMVQTVLLIAWVTLNGIGLIQHWDPYPFILLNLMLSFQAAYAAPVIMMSQNRQAAIDRHDAHYDYEVNLKAELEIELLHDQINLLRGEEIAAVIEMLESQQQKLQQVEVLLQQMQPPND